MDLFIFMIETLSLYLCIKRLYLCLMIYMHLYLLVSSDITILQSPFKNEFQLCVQINFFGVTLTKICVTFPLIHILLLSNTKVGMVKMLNKLKISMVIWKIVINWDKTNYLVVGETKLLISPVLVEGIDVKKI